MPWALWLGSTQKRGHSESKLYMPYSPPATCLHSRSPSHLKPSMGTTQDSQILCCHGSVLWALV